MLKKLLSSQLRQNMASGVIATIINILVVALSYPLYLRMLGYEQYGVWLVLSSVMTFTQLSGLGIGPAVMKFVAEESALQNLPGIQRYAVAAMLILGVSGTLAMVLLLILNNPLVGLFKLDTDNARNVSRLLPWVGLASVYAYLLQIIGAVLSGLGRMDRTNYIQAAGSVMQLLTAGLLLWMGMGIVGMLMATVCACITMHVLLIFSIRQILKMRFFCRENVSFAHMVKVFHFGKNIFLGSIVSMLLNPFNRVMVSRYIGVAALPIYDIAYTGGMHIRNLVEVALRSILPEISHAVAEKTDAAKAKIFSIQHQAWGFVFKFGLVVYALLFMLAPLLLHLWLRDSFVATMPEIFRIMLVGTYASLIGVPAFYLLMGMGCVRHTLYSHAIQALLNVILVVMVASITGQLTLHSVVSCTSVAMAVSTAYLIWQSKRSMRNLFAHQ
ncbi:MAG: oligosaccharide flippase family protein [Smithella sp.]